MSTSIKQNGLSFFIFGHGHDNTLPDSGEGNKRSVDYIEYDSAYAAIDATGRYVWLAGVSEGLKKFDLLTFEEVDRGSIPAGGGIIYALYHPTNVANNYGIFFTGESEETAEVYVFNLTDNSIITHRTLINAFFMPQCDCIIVDGEVRLCTLTQSRASNYIYRFNISDIDITQYGFANNPKNASCGFITENSAFSYYEPEWFYQNKAMFGVSLSGALTWSVQASRSGGSGFPNVSQIGWGNNGYLWMPCYVNDTWCIGAFVPSSSTDFETPSPTRVFGEFPELPYMKYQNHYHVAHNTGRTKVAFTTSLGVYFSDYETLWKLTDDIHYALAANDNTIICSDGRYLTYVYRL